MAKNREARFNAKARQSKRGGSSASGSTVGANRPKATGSTAASAAAAAPAAIEVDASLFGGEQGGANTLILPKKDKTLSAASTPSVAAKKVLTAKQKRRMAAFVEKQVKKEKRVDLISKLAQSTFAVDNASLLRSSKQLGKKDSLKDRLRRSLLEERAGLPQSDATTPLLVPAVANNKRTAAQVAAAEDDEDDTPAAPAPAPTPTPQTKPLIPKQTAPAEPNPTIQNKFALPKRKPAVVADAEAAAAAAAAAADGEDEVVDNKPAFYVPVNRDPELQARRLELPILAEEQVIMETINRNLFLIIAGETGSGKTTQVPQFLYEAGYGNPESDRPGKIAITQPRRVAAVAMTARVASELNVPKDRVAYQIRYDNTVSAATIVQFMTDGVLLKEISTDFLLKNYSVIILDEAHERNLNTDILIGLLSRLVPLRERLAKEGKVLGPTGKPLKPLRVIIMSATLRVSDFTENKVLFPAKPPPVISVNARQYPVTVHFNKRTPLNDYVTAAYNKVCQIHRKLPGGGILVFVTGRSEIDALCRKLRQQFPAKDAAGKELVDTTDPEWDTKRRSGKFVPDADEAREAVMGLEEESGSLDVEDEEEKDVLSNFEKFSKERKNGGGEVDPDNDDGSSLVKKDDESVGPLHVLPLYALLSPAQQLRVFEAVPEGHRLCVVATNVAETSITIPNIKYVVDTGKSKERHHDLSTGVQSFKVDWISKASADQRSGRAGRTGPGHCYRLYSSAVFNDQFPQFSMPEIQRIPIEATVLMMKAMNIDNVVNFPFPSPPDRTVIAKGEKLLVALGALNSLNKQVTPLGRQMAAFPLSPRYSKMILASDTYNVEQYMVALVAALTVDEIFIRDMVADNTTEDPVEQEELRLQRSQYRRVHEKFAPPANTGDLHKQLRVVNAYEKSTNKESFCDENLLRPKAMSEIGKLRKQLLGILSTLRTHKHFSYDLKNVPDPTASQEKLLSQVVISGFMDQIAIKNTEVPLGPLGYAYRTMSINEDVFIHPTSVMHRVRPDWLVFTDVMQTKRKYIKGVTALEPKWLPNVAPELCFFGKPVENPPPRYDAAKDMVLCVCMPTYGPLSWPLPPIEVAFPESLDKYKYFARFLLDGSVSPGLRPFVEHWVSKPTIINKSWTQTKILDLVQALQTEKIASKAALEARWATNPSFLYNAVLQWLDRPQHQALQLIWPPLDKQKAPASSRNKASSSSTPSKKPKID